MNSITSFVRTLILVCIFAGSATAQGGSKTPQKLWKPQADEVYFQEVARKVPSEKPVQSVAVFQDICFAVIDGKISRLNGDSFNQEKSSPDRVKRLISINGDLWSLAADGIYRMKGDMWQKIDNQEYVDLCMHQGVLHGATVEEIFRLENNHFVSIKPKGGYYSSDITMLMEDGSQLHADPVRLGPIQRIASYSGTLMYFNPEA